MQGADRYGLSLLEQGVVSVLPKSLQAKCLDEVEKVNSSES